MTTFENEAGLTRCLVVVEDAVSDAIANCNNRTWDKMHGITQYNEGFCKARCGMYSSCIEQIDDENRMARRMGIIGGSA
jgi:hypothetical protein